MTRALTLFGARPHRDEPRETPRVVLPRYRRWLVLVVVIGLTLARAAWLATHSPDDLPPLTEGQHRVRRVIDGDTLVLESNHRVRLQGIDTPELARNGAPAQPFAIEAKGYAQAFVHDAHGAVRVTLTDERLDRYARSLAFLWNEDRCLNEELVREGLAEARLEYRFSGPMRRRLRDAQQQARLERKGIWADALGD